MKAQKIQFGFDASKDRGGHVKVLEPSRSWLDGIHYDAGTNTWIGSDDFFLGRPRYAREYYRDGQ